MTAGACSVVDIGVPVRSVNWVKLHPGRDRAGAPCLYAVMGQQAAGLFVLQIDPATGAFRQFITDVPEANYPTATHMSRAGVLYVGAAYAGHLLSFEPVRDTLVDLGPIHPERATFPCRLDEDGQGRIWVGSYPGADLTCFDPETGTFARHGRMDETDMYNYPHVNDDGTVACLVRVIRPHVVVFDPATGAKTVVGPVSEKERDTFSARKGIDGFVYIESSLGHYRITGMAATPVDIVPEAPPDPSLADGSTYRFADAEAQLNRMLEIRTSVGETRTFELDYEAVGTDIFLLHAGPDGCVYGSSIMPLHLFLFDPHLRELTYLGKCTSATGEVYSMANLADRLYLSSYPRAILSVYDPGRPYHFGTDPDDNPHDIGRLDEIAYRPRSTLAGPLGRVWLASIPDYGCWGGPLAWYDPVSGASKSYERIVGDASCYTLAWLPAQGLLAVGTSIRGGSGTEPKAAQAELMLWNPVAEQVVWRGTLERKVAEFNALLTGSDGRLYGTVHGPDAPPELVVFDPVSRAFVACVSLPGGHPLDLGLQLTPADGILGFTSDVVYQFDSASLALHVWFEAPGQFSTPGPLLDGTLYFATQHRLRAICRCSRSSSRRSGSQ